MSSLGKALMSGDTLTGPAGFRDYRDWALAEGPQDSSNWPNNALTHKLACGVGTESGIY